jgi:alkylation response protein AidB-like acyl-CoA dehydrogenase
VCLARTDPTLKKRQGLTYFIVDLHAPGVDVRELRHLGGEVDFNEVFLDDVRIPDDWRIGAAGDGWRVAGSSLAGERQMVSGAGGGLRIGGASADRLVERAQALGRTDDPLIRQRLMAVYAEEKVRGWTNQRLRGSASASIGKVHQGALNQRIQLLAADLLGPGATAWEGDTPFEVSGMLRSRANTIEGGTTEVNKNILGERVLGLPREPDPWADAPWEEIPRS